MIVWRRYRHNAIQPQRFFPIRHHSRGRLVGVSFRPKPRKKGKSNIHILQGLSFDQTANPDRDTPLLQLGQIQAKAQSGIHFNRAFQNIVTCVFEGSHAFIADELQPRGIIQKLKDELCIVRAYPKIRY